MMNLAWPTLWQGQIWFLMHLYGEILKCSFFYNCLSWIHNTFKKCLTLWDNGLYKYQMSSWPVTFYPMPLIWTATCHQNGCNPHIWLNKIYFIISCIWPWPILTLLKRSGERLRTFRSSSYLKPIIFWVYNSCYLVLFCQMMGKSMSLTMQELSKRSETLCQVWAITNRLYFEMHGPFID